MQYPDSIERFSEVLDNALRKVNSDYDAKRYEDMVLQFPKINVVQIGTFDAWLEAIDRLGGQNKVPRLSNDRTIMDQILQVASEKIEL